MQKIFLVLILLVGCKDGSSNPPVTHSATDNPTKSNAQSPLSSDLIQLERLEIKASAPTTKGSSELQLAIGNHQTFIAVAHYSDRSSQVVTDSSQWRVSDEAVASFLRAGQLQGKASGVIEVSAINEGILSNSVKVEITNATLNAISVTPPVVSMAKGQTQQLSAMATYSDNTSADVNNVAIWTLSHPDVAVVSNTGLVSGIKVGSTTITASLNGLISNSVNLSVTDALMTEIAITPSAVSMIQGQTRQLIATAIYSDGSLPEVTQSATWSVGDSSIATVSSSGLLSGISAGNTTVVATINGLSSNVVQVNVSEVAMTSLAVTPEIISVPKGESQQLLATATYSDGKVYDISDAVTWSSDETAAVTEDGLLTGMAVATTSVSASAAGLISNSVEVSVTDAVLRNIAVTPESVFIEKGKTQQLVAMATYSDSSRVNISDSVSWVSDDSAVATVTSEGLLSGVEASSTNVTAHKDGISSNTVQVDVFVCQAFADYSPHSSSVVVTGHCLPNP